jgi:hypothetical protein
MKSKMDRRLFWLRAVAMVAIVFGLLSIMSGGEVVFGEAAARSAAGNYIPLVVWGNFIAGFAYVAAGVGLWLAHRWAFRLAAGVLILTVAIFVGFGAYVLSGAAYEMRTVWAMLLRTVVWALIAVFAWRQLRRQERERRAINAGTEGT